MSQAFFTYTSFSHTRLGFHMFRRYNYVRIYVCAAGTYALKLKVTFIQSTNQQESSKSSHWLFQKPTFSDNGPNIYCIGKICTHCSNSSLPVISLLSHYTFNNFYILFVQFRSVIICLTFEITALLFSVDSSSMTGDARGDIEEYIHLSRSSDLPLLA